MARALHPSRSESGSIFGREQPAFRRGLGACFCGAIGGARRHGRRNARIPRSPRLSHPLAQFNLGMMYAQGQGVVRNEETAFGWFERAAQQGDAGAQFNLGMRHHRASSGEGLPAAVLESRVEAYKWFFLSAAQGYRGSGSACERVTLSMSHDELADGNRRAAAFVITKPSSVLVE
jgi:TPR repeat protein